MKAALGLGAVALGATVLLGRLAGTAAGVPPALVHLAHLVAGAPQASGERTEPPTPKRLQEARRLGEVARSADLTSAGVLLRRGPGSPGPRPGGRPGPARPRHRPPRRLLGPEPLRRRHPRRRDRASGSPAPPALLAAAGVAASLAQTGPVLATEALRPDLARLHPARGLKRLFTFQRLGIVPNAKTAAAALGAVVWVLPRATCLPRLGWRLLALPRLGVPTAAALLLHLAAAAAAASGGALLALGIADLALARHRHLRQLRMTRQEVREEHKREEGDPAHKAERRRAHRAALAGPVRPLRQAAVVVVNPTHVAVALHFDDDLDAPVLGDRGTGATAAGIRARARRLGIPFVRDVPLARALVALDPGAEVPEALYAAVAAVLTAIHGAARRAAPPRPDRRPPT